MSGILNVMLAGKAAGAAAYQGPLDLQPTAPNVVVWWGLRAASLANVGNPVVRLLRSSDSTQADISTVTSGANKGHLDTSNAFFNGSTYTVVTLYDQAGGGHNFIQSGAAPLPTFVLGALGSEPVIRFDGATQYLIAGTGASTIAQPNWVSAVAKTTSTAAQGYFGDNTSGNSIGFNGTNASLYAGATLTNAAATNSWHAIQTVMNSPGGATTSDVYVDGSSNTGNGGSQDLSTLVDVGKDGYGNFFAGDLVEIAVWGGLAPSSGDKSGMNSNQHTFWGF